MLKQKAFDTYLARHNDERCANTQLALHNVDANDNGVLVAERVVLQILENAGEDGQRFLLRK